MATTTTATKQELIDLIKDRVELKSLKVSKQFSEETLAYTATVYLDGDVAASAENRGRGGQTIVNRFYDGRSETFKDQLDELREFAESLPALENKIYGDLGPLKMRVSLMLDLLAEHEDQMKEIKRRINRGQMVFREADQPEGAYSYVKGGVNEDGSVSEQGRKWLNENANPEIIYNDELV